MAASFDPKSGSSSRVQPQYFPINPSEANNNVGGSSSSSLFMSRDDVVDTREVRENWKREMMKLKSPLPPRQPERSRVSLCLDRAIEFELMHGRKLHLNIDTRTLRRTISNRISAQKSRMKRSQYITDMEKKVQDLEEFVSSLTPKIEIYKETKRQLQLENDSLRNQVDIRAAESKISEDGLEQKRREITELKKNLKNKNEWLLQPSNSNLELMMRVSGPGEHTMQVSGPEKQMMPVSGPEEQMRVQVSGPEEQMMPVRVSDLEEQNMPVSGSDELGPKPYSIKFYQQRLMQMEMNQFINQELNPGPALAPLDEPEYDSLIELITFDDEDDEEVDQYLNLELEEDVTLHFDDL